MSTIPTVNLCSEVNCVAPEEYEDLKREKRDAYTFSNGTVYHGDWKGNLRDGDGIQLWPDGARYEGTWSNELV
jgi:MORN repeat